MATADSMPSEPEQEMLMKALKGSKTEKSLKDAFAGESQANRRYLYFAAKADVEGQNDVASIFRSTAAGETGHAPGHLEYLELQHADRSPESDAGPAASHPAGSVHGDGSRAGQAPVPERVDGILDLVVEQFTVVLL